MTRAAAVVVAAVVVAGSAAHAQTRATPPPAETASRSETTTDSAIAVRANLFEGYDDNVAADTAVGVQGSRLGLFAGPYSAADAELTLRRAGSRLTFDGAAGTAMRYSPTVVDLSTAAHHASARLAAKVGASRLTLSQSARFAPLQSLDVLGDMSTTTATPFDAALTTQNRLQSQSDADLAFDLSRSTELTLTSGYAWQQLRGSDALNRYDVGVRLRHSLTSHLQIGGGYNRQWNVTGGIASSTVHDLTVSTAYDKPLSQTRHLRLESSVGTSMLDEFGRQQLRAIGSVHVSRDIARTWAVGGGYARQYLYFDWLAQPVFANRVSGDVTGRLSNRLRVRAEGSYAGSQEVPTSPNAFTVSMAGATATFSVTRTLGIYAGYTRFAYDFPNDPVGLALARTVGRNSIRAGVNVHAALAETRAKAKS